MRALEIGDFKEDVGAALARASSGEVVTLTEEGQPVAELGPVRMSTYAQLRDIRDEAAVRLSIEESELALSMGMSQDLEWAIAEGATIVRLGTAIFGARRL